MAKVYMTFERPSTDEYFIYAGVTACAVGIPGFTELAVWLPFPNEPSANTIISALRSYALSEILVATGVSVPVDQVVLFGAPT